MKLFPLKSELRVTLLYLLFGGLWILLSDRLLAWMVTDIQTLTWMQTYKGWFYVVVSGLLIYLLLRQALDHERRTRAELNEVNERFRLLFDTSMDTIIMTASNGSILTANPAACRMFGRTEEEICRLGRDGITDLTDPRLTVMKEKYTSSGRFLGELNFVRSSGEIFPCEVSATLFTDRDGQTHGSMILRDITERKRAQTVLMESEERYRGLFEHSPISLWEEDYSLVKTRLKELQAVGVEDFETYFLQQPQAAAELVSLVRILDVNEATLEMYAVGSKKELYENLSVAFKGDTGHRFINQLVKVICEGRQEFTWDGFNHTLSGSPININLRWSVVPGYEADLSKVIVSIVDVTARKQAEAKTQRQLEFLTALRDIDRTIASTFDIRLSLNALLAQTLSLLKADAASVLLSNPSMNTLELGAEAGFRRTSHQAVSVKIGNSHAGKVVRERRVIHIPDLRDDPDEIFRSGALKEDGFVSYYGAPLIVKGKAIGILEVFQRSPVDRDEEWMGFLNTLAGRAAIAIDNARMFDNVQQTNLELSMAYDATIESWSHALDLRDKETEGHTLRVTEMTLAMARLMGIEDTEMVHIRRGALLHDIGNLGVPEHVLFKLDALNESEWEIIHKHPIFAFEMLAPIGYLKDAIDIPYCHHEKWDGSGYPRGLRNEQIPLSARIFAVVDIWDALNSDRPYRPAWPRDKIREYIQSLTGTHLDPRITSLFLNSGIMG